MENSSSIFKFVTIRNPSSEVNSRPNYEIQPETGFVKELIDILRGDKNQAEKILLMNQKLNAFIQSANFYKTKLEFTESVNKVWDKIKIIKVLKEPELTETLNLYKNLYINIVIRSITKSNTTEIYKLLVEYIKILHQKLNVEKINAADIGFIRILLPENLIISFRPPTKPFVAVDNPNIAASAALNLKIQNLHIQKEQIQNAKKENSKQLHIEQKKLMKLQNVIVATPVTQKDSKTSTSVSKIALSESTLPIDLAREAVEKLLVVSETLQLDENEKDLQLTKLNNLAFQYVPQSQYVQIGTQWVNIANFEEKVPPKTDDEAIVVYANGCYLKFPFQVADLRVVEQKTVGYLPAEIAHINNTQQGEKQEKKTRRLERSELFESLITEDEIFRETDTQSTEKNSFAKAATELTAEEISANINTSVSGTYGVVTASVDAGFSYAQSSQNSNSSSQSYATEIVEKIVDKVSKKVIKERSEKTIREFEEIVTHIIDNTDGDGPKSYVYRWLKMLISATLKNYGKRLMFKIPVAHPSHFYLTSAIQEKPRLNIPPNPKDFKKNSTDLIIKDFYQKTGLDVDFSVDNIKRNNYLAWGELYKVKLEQPPSENKIVGYSSAGTDGAKAVATDIIIPPGYMAKQASIAFYFRNLPLNFLIIRIGRRNATFWQGADSSIITTIILDDETDKLPISVLQYSSGYQFNVEVDCKLDEFTFSAWQIKCYHAIIEAYENIKAEAESKMSEWNPNNPGLNPTRKNDLIKTELKKGALSKMFRCNPFWITDNYVVGKEYDPDCCKDSLNAEKVRFLETVFDWNNMTYDLHPYFYGDKDNWSQLLNLTDDDPHFEAFLQASYATVVVPVFRDSEKEIAAINFIINNSIANHSVIPANLKHLLQDLETNTPFGYIPENTLNADFIDIRKEYDKTGKLKIFYLDASGNEIICTVKDEIDKEGKPTKFYYNSSNIAMMSEIKEGVNSNGQQYFYYFDKNDKKVICHKAKTEYDIKGNETPYYSKDLGIFQIPTDLVILEKGVQDGVVLRGYPEDQSAPSSDVIIPKQYSPAIIQDK